MTTINKTTIQELNLKRYMGKWYEIARFDNWFERNMQGVSAEYSFRPDGKINVKNCGYKEGINGKPTCSIGKARSRKNGHPGELEVAFFLGFYSDYNILELSPDYEWALVGSSTDKYLWILSRTPHLPQTTLRHIVERAQARGYNTDHLIYTKQSDEL